MTALSLLAPELLVLPLAVQALLVVAASLVAAKPERPAAEILGKPKPEVGLLPFAVRPSASGVVLA